MHCKARRVIWVATVPRHASVTARADGTLVAIAGMGGTAAAAAACKLVEAGAAALVSWGMAGGLDPALWPRAGFSFRAKSPRRRGEYQHRAALARAAERGTGGPSAARQAESC